jgi:hypothetical protein
MNGFSLGLLAFGVFACSVFFWFRLLNDVALEGRRRILYLGVAIAIGTGIAALGMDPGWIGGTAAMIAVIGGVAWSGLGLLAGQSTQEPNLILGEPLPAFSAPDHNGERFEIESLRGHPVLIKIFRGHW